MKTILSFGDSLRVSTGYGIVNEHVLKYLAKRYIIYHYGIGHAEPLEQIQKNLFQTPGYVGYPGCAGNILQWANKLNPEYVFTSNDYFMWNYLASSLKNKTTLVSYSIIDGPYAAEFYKPIIEQIDIPVVATEYAKHQLKEINIDAKVIPHGVDTEIFNSQHSNEYREHLKWTDKFVYLSVNRNIWRKTIPYLLMAFKKVKEIYPDSILVLLMAPVEPGGYDLNSYIRILGLTNKDVMFHSSYTSVVENLSPNELAGVYKAADAFVTSSLGEGFGLPILESMACGTPVIGPRNSSFPELITNRGYLYECAKNLDDSDVIIPTTFKDTSYFLKVPDVQDLFNKMIDARENNEKRLEYSKKAEKFAKELDWKKILPKWDEIFK